ncbi:hypothetical protein MC7420_1076 [Coleofasciculus chthonoplastes PCC 7420]|uniref:Uncharacterized protein n=1 Tax=Coleofasciculus chthonoplastes PCC 7420 TaxID=118168 RepID=B4VXH8_9CYAN|nr:hypothetical protein MC7420_1076 [Coleofasciculus chthonoplastes PCC 7420]
MTPEKEQALKDYIKGIAQILYEETSPEQCKDARKY